ncbi:uncharacterized protein TNCV_3621251 [Trichonephila clavipes]|nr:uncharacterized protein TNCV_3621251 [Trichonephila clavipes]
MARRNQLDDFTRRRMIGKLEKVRTVISVAAEFGINKSVVSRAWKAFQTTGTAVRKVGGGRLRTTTAGDDRYIILQVADGSQQASLLSNSLQQRGDKCRGLLWPDAFTKGAKTTYATVYSGAESTKTGQLMNGVVSSLRMREGSVPEAILNAF